MNYMNKDFDWHQASPRMVGDRLHFRAPDHPLAIQSPKSGMVGYVNLGRHVASVEVGRWLQSDEVVRYKDGDPCNVSADNLIVVNRADMSRLINLHPPKANFICLVCNLPFQDVASHAERRVTCSVECRSIHQRRFEISPEELRELIWKYPTVTVAQMFAVSDKAIEKRCKKFGIEKPPRGYWAKQYAAYPDVIMVAG